MLKSTRQGTNHDTDIFYLTNQRKKGYFVSSGPADYISYLFQEGIMKLPRYFLACGLVCSLIAVAAISCGEKGPNAEDRIKALEAKGVPDSILSNVKLYLYNVTNYAKTGQAGNGGRYKDSLKTGLSAAEAWYEKTSRECKTYIESARKSIADRKAGLTGLSLKDCDSILKIADSLVAINWPIQARLQFEKLDSKMPSLLDNQKKAAGIRPKLFGTWKNVHVLLPPEDEKGAHYKAVETSTYSFAKDGAFSGIEEKLGQSNQVFKEDWKFFSWGKYDLMGDSIYLFITREKCAKQIYTTMNLKTKIWERKVQPTYDSTITNGKKDKYITFDDLKLSFKKIK